MQKNHLLIFSSFLDIWENVEWPRFFLDHPVYLRGSGLGGATVGRAFTKSWVRLAVRSLSSGYGFNG